MKTHIIQGTGVSYLQNEQGVYLALSVGDNRESLRRLEALQSLLHTASEIVEWRERALYGDILPDRCIFRLDNALEILNRPA